MSYSFDQALGFTLLWEGGYVNDPADPGGETNFGISKRAFPDVDIAALTRDSAEVIYAKHYWRPICGEELPPSLGVALFDFAVNSGVSRASRALQRALGVRQDGDIGPKTLGAVREDLETYAARSALEIAQNVTSQRMEMICRLVARHPEKGRFLNGWTRRILTLDRLTGTL